MVKYTGADPPTDPEVGGSNIEELLLLVADAEKGQKRQALGSLLEIGMEGCRCALERAVRNDDDADLRNGAMETLVQFGAVAIPTLVQFLQDHNEEVRNFSTVMLGDIGNPEAVAALVGALRDTDANVRHGAAEALGKIGDRRAVPSLVEMQHGDFWDRFVAGAALGKLGYEHEVLPGAPEFPVP